MPLPILLCVLVLFARPVLSGDISQLDYQRDVRPVLAAKCFKCHGPDEETREADLRLDISTQSSLDSGIIVPGKPQASELVRRITSHSDLEVMPPSDSKLTLTPEERRLLTLWIEQGGKYAQHWAFEPPVPPELPGVNDANWVRNPVDRFILSRIEQAGLEPSPEADRYTLVRRLYLDLIGLPPTIEEADAFVHDQRSDAYERLVDKLLSSEQYGEKWARHWLDLARYADTNGYEKDRPRSIWPYRDWVIRALNDDMPFDQFSIEQLAGDMLPEATVGQRVATGFHRNTMLNEEGGIDPLEYRFLSVVDRVATTGTVWLGMTIGCAQCHTHKYDPITHTDYYSMFALLNNADEPDLILEADDVADRRRKTHAQIAELENKLPEAFPVFEGTEMSPDNCRQAFDAAFSQWIEDQKRRLPHWQIVRPMKMSTNLPRLELLEDGSILSSGDITKRDLFELEFDLSHIEQPVTALRLEVLPDDRLPARGPGRAFYEGRKGDFFLSELTASVADGKVQFHHASHSFGKISIGNGSADAANVFDGDGSTGWSTATREGESHHLVLNFQQPLPTSSPLDLEMLFERHFAASLGRFRVSVTSDAGVAEASSVSVENQQLLLQDKDSLDVEQLARLKSCFLQDTPQLAEARKPIEALRRQLADFPTTMVMQERPEDYRRPTHRHHRGEYLQPRELVTPRIPQLFQSASQQSPQTRLEFAQWLVSNQNPLVGRVTVNRHWQYLFGRGLVATSEDFGTQSSFPTHPELLDWLATKFTSRDGNDSHALFWSMKKLHRLLVTSATYRQESSVTPELQEQDPVNLLLARGARFRLQGELVRDAVLRASGLLTQKVGGPSVFPPQPVSVYAAAYGSPKWPASQAADRYRRSLYTFAKRTAPFAAYAVFDAPTGESCIVRRDRSNTPLQALTLLNDEMFLEASRAVAQQVTARKLSKEKSVAELFRRFLTRPPHEDEARSILNFYDEQLSRLQAGEIDARQITDREMATPQEAAWVMVARVLLNLDETITKP